MAVSSINQPVPIAGVSTTGTDNIPGMILATAARTHTGGDASDGVYASAELYNPGARGVRIFTVVANGSGTVAFKVQIKNPYTDAWFDLPGAAIAAHNNGSKTITVYPGVTGIADASDVTCNQHLGPQWRVHTTVATATETFSVAADYLL